MKKNRLKLILLFASVALGTLAIAGPAVRFADRSAHGGVISDTGLPPTTKVYINGLPAVGVGAMHTCPAESSNIPHVGGSIFTGSTKVFVVGNPVAIDGSAAYCIGAIDTIIGGSQNVYVNQ